MATRRTTKSLAEQAASLAGASAPAEGPPAGALPSAAGVPAEQRAAELEALRQVTLSLAASLELEAVLDAILASALKLLPEARYGDIFFYHTGHLTFGASRSSDGLRGKPFAEPRPEGLTYTVARSGEPLLIGDMRTHPMYASRPPDLPRGAIIGLPLQRAGQVVGVMNVAYAVPRDFPEAELRVLQLLSDQAAVAIQNAWLYETTRRQLQELAVLHQVAMAGSEATDEDALIERATAIIGAELFPDNFGVLLLDPAAGVLRLHPSYQGVNATQRRRTIVLGLGLTGAVAVDGQPRRIADVTAEIGYFELTPGTRSELCVPLKVGDHILGVVNAESERPGAFTEADERLLTTLGGQLAQSIERLRVEASQRHAALRSAEGRAVLYRASQEISGSLDPYQVYAATHRAVVQLMPCHAFLIALVDEAEQNIEMVYAADRGREVAMQRVGLDEGLAGYIISTGRSLRASNPEELSHIRPVRFGDPDPVLSLVAEPMRLRGQVFGMLSTQSYRLDSYTAEDQQMLSLLANQAAVAIEHARLFEAQREQRQLAEVLRETGVILSASLELDAVLNRLLEQVARVVPYETGTILLVEGARLRIARHAGYERLGGGRAAQVTDMTFDLESTATVRRLVETGEAYLIPDTRNFPGWVEVEVSNHIRSWIGAPLMAHGQAIAVFALDHSEPNAFEPKHVRHLATFASHAALAVKNAQLYEAERRRVGALTALHETGLDVSQQLELSTLLQTIVRRAGLLLGADSGGLYLVTPDETALECVVSLNRLRSFTGLHLKPGEGVAGRVVVSGTPLVVDDYYTWEGRAPVFEGASFRSVLGTAIEWQGRVIGALILTDDRPGLFSRGDLEFAGLFAAQAAVGIINARLYADVRGQATELGRLFAASQEMGACREPAAVLEVLAKHLTLGLEVTSTYILEVNTGANKLTVLAEYWSEHAGDMERMSDLGRSYDIRDYPSTLQSAASGEVRTLQRDDVRLSPMERAQMYEYGTYSVLIVPIIGRGEVLGEAELWESRVRRTFTAAEQRLAQTMVRQAADVIENVRLIAALESEKGRLELLFNLSQRLTASLDLAEVAGHALDLVRTALGAATAQMFIPERGTDRLLVVAVAGEAVPADAPDEARLGQGLAGRAAAARELLLVPDLNAGAGGPRLPVGADTSAAAVPLVLGDELLGVFTLRMRGHHRLGDEHRPILAAIAAPMALALQNARLYEAETQRARHLALLNDITRTTIGALDLPEMLQALTELLAQLFTSDAAYLALWDEERRMPVPAAAFGELRGRYPALAPQPGETTLTESALRAGQALVIDDVNDSPYLSANIASLSAARSMLVLPLVAGGRPLGAAIIAFNTPHSFSPQEVARGEQAAGQVALAIARAQLFDETRRRAEEVTRVSGVLRALNAMPDVLTAFPGIVEGLRGICGCDRASLALFDAAGEALTVMALDQSRAELAVGTRLPLSGLAAATDVLAGRVHFAPDLEAETDYPVEWALYQAGHRSSLSLPLRVGTRVIGTLALCWPAVHGYGDVQLSALSQITEAVALALEKNRLFDETRRRADELGVLAGVSGALRAARTVDDMLPVFLQKACEVTGAHVGGIYLVDPLTGDLVRRGNHPPNPATLGTHMAYGQGITGRVAATGQMYITQELAQDPTADFSDPATAEFLQGVRSNIAVPLRSSEGVVGVMHVGARHPHAFTLSETNLLTAIAEIAANALQRAGLLETLEQRVAERTQALAQANARLQELDRLKDQFISNVSHELRTPLTNIKLHLSLLDKRGVETLDRYLPTLQRETERLRRLIEDLLDLSRLQAQIMPPRREQQSLDGLIAEVTALHITRAEARGLSLDHQANPEPVHMDVDRAQMLQVLTNLVGNAVAYTPAGGRVTISSAYADEGGQPGVLVRVHNTGAAIRADDLPHLFERFFRGQTGLESGEAGTGLGLSICREIVDQHGGSIRVDSAETDGTTFTVWLPLL